MLCTSSLLLVTPCRQVFFSFIMNGMSTWTCFLFANPKVKLGVRKQNKKNTHLGSMVSGKDRSNAKGMTEDDQKPGKGA